ncbi:ABC transporter permease [Sorangium sp. So ce426]|uniref:ABC transporter permease n=1 Tax=unclassified Sorangium TaxID=2621164 RepID=UPI003F5B71AF
MTGANEARRIWTSFVAICVKEFLHIRRDPMALRIALAIPILQLVLLGFIDQTVRNLPTVVVDQDFSRSSRDLMDRLRATDTLEITRVTTSPKEAREEIISGRARVGIVIPPDFQDSRVRGKQAKILVLIDGSDSSASSQALASVTGLAAHVTLEEIRSQAPKGEQGFGLSVQPIMLFNPDGRTANYIIPGLIAFVIQTIGMVMTALAIVRERERGTLEQLLVTPVHPLGLMLGKLAPYLIVGVAENLLLLFIMRFGFGVPIHGNLLFLFVISTIFLFACLSIGLFISTRAQTQPEAQQMAQLFTLPSFFLTGYLFPVAGLPLALYVLGRLLPATHMIEVMRGVVLRDAGPLDLLSNVLALVAMCVVLVWGSVRRFRNLIL